jgi:hypothetical protein
VGFNRQIYRQVPQYSLCFESFTFLRNGHAVGCVPFEQVRPFGQCNLLWRHATRGCGFIPSQKWPP